MDRFENLRVFTKVVESGSFAGAAARLGISASMVSLHVKALEERLGARLLNRTTRKVSVTDVGRAYYERCTRVLGDLEEADLAVGEMQTAPRGDLRVNSTTGFGVQHIGPAIADFAERFPGISVELMLSDRPIDLIEEGFDVAVRVDPLPDSRLIARKLVTVQLVLCGTPEYFANRGTPRNPGDLADHSCLEITSPSFFRRWHLTDETGKEVNLSLSGTVRSNNPFVLLHAALSSHGILYTARYMVADSLKAGQLVTVLDDYVLPPLTVHAVYPHGRHLSAKVRAFVDFLADRFGPETPWEKPARSSAILNSLRV
jgi:DNA-binding transcriptional LysR family regulator